jgi:hypothetical protein
VSLAGYLQSKVAGRWGSGVLSVSPSADPRFKTFLTAFNPLMFRQVVKAIDATGLPQA